MDGALISPPSHSVAEIAFIGIWLFNVRSATRSKPSDTVAFLFDEEPTVIVFELLTSLIIKLASEPDTFILPCRFVVLAVIDFSELLSLIVLISPTLISVFAAIVSCDFSPVLYRFTWLKLLLPTISPYPPPVKLNVTDTPQTSGTVNFVFLFFYCRVYFSPNSHGTTVPLTWNEKGLLYRRRCCQKRWFPEKRLSRLYPA